MSSSEPRASAEALYRERLLERRAAFDAASRTADRLGNLRLVLALVGLVLVITPLVTRSGAAWWGLLPLILAFLILGTVQDRVFRRRQRLGAAVRFYEDGLCRLEERWRALADDGADLGEALRAEAPHADDLDLFGPASLFQLLSRAVTAQGRLVLGRHLAVAAPPDEVRARQAAVGELSAALDLREHLVTAAAGDDAGHVSDKPLLAWAESGSAMPRAGLLRALGVAQPALLAAAIVVQQLTEHATFLVAVVVLHLITLAATRRMSAERAAVLSGPERVLSRFAASIAVLERAEVEAPLLRALRGRLVPPGEGPPASARIARLEKLVAMLDARLNPFFALTVGPALLWDLNLVLRADAWREANGRALRGWLQAVGELEALASLAALAMERPDYAFPSFAEGPGRFVAEGLAHPLIDRRHVVPSDLDLGGPGSVLLLSGSNMSGKSTLLRSVGVNVVLAQAGAPVAARALTLTPMTLATSVKVVDSLAAGTSHFYAELKRLKYIVDRAGDAPTQLLYLLDEMLHGTNSRERFLGAVSVIRWLSERGAMGIVTTHDLALAAVADDLPPGRVVNRHFSDQVTESGIRFDYVLRDGPVRSTNALRLMRQVGIPVDLPAGRALQVGSEGAVEGSEA